MVSSFWLENKTVAMLNAGLITICCFDIHLRFVDKCWRNELLNFLCCVLSNLHLFVYLLIFVYILCLVFDVDIGDGEPIRKLPYNRSGIFLVFGYRSFFDG